MVGRTAWQLPKILDFFSSRFGGGRQATPGERGILSETEKNFTAEWSELCDWFRGKAAEVLQKTKSARAQEMILFTVATFCRDQPPTTYEGLTAWRSFAKRHVELWETTPLPDSDGDLPLLS
jgi:hypothetical protein